jgi:hypothetical protein
LPFFELDVSSNVESGLFHSKKGQNMLSGNVPTRQIEALLRSGEKAIRLCLRFMQSGILSGAIAPLLEDPNLHCLELS